MAAPSSSSYSSLLRRSKLASYNPQIDQVYTTTSAHLARQNFGFKRPLPSATTKISPFVRVTQLDSNEGRTVFRKATRETSYVKKWSETGVGLQSEAYTSLSSRKWDNLEVQSRFVPEGFNGGQVKSPEDAAAAPTRTPNFLAMDEREFERFLEDLGDRRDEFRQFVAQEAAKTTPGVTVEDFDLYTHAQSNPNELVRLVERFLRLPSSRTSFRSTPLPQIHPTLALQYATPTPLESALATPIPGRLLGPSPEQGAFRRSGPMSSLQFSGAPIYSSVLSTISPINAQNTGGLPTTSFYPDASSIRSNTPGRANFRIVKPTIRVDGYANRATIGSKLRQSAEFRPASAEYEPTLLALRSVDVDPVVDTPSYTANSPALRHRIGTPAYSGSLPPELARSFGRGGGGGGGGATPRGLVDYFDNDSSSSSAKAASYASLGVSGKGPRDLVAGKRKLRSKEEQERWLRTKESLMEDNIGRSYGKRKGGKGQPGAGGKSKKGSKEELIGRLQSLLGNQD